MAHMYRHDAKKSHVDKVNRMCGGYTKKAAGGKAHVKAKIAHRKKGGKVMKADGDKASHRLDRKKRMDGGMLMNAEQRARQRMIDEAARQRRAAETAPVPYTAADRAAMTDLVRRTMPVRKKGGHVDAADLKADKALIKRAMAMHDKQEHKGEHTDLSKLKKGGKVHHRADGGRIPGGVIGKMKKGKGKAHTNVNVIVAPPRPDDKTAMPPAGAAPSALPRVPVPMPMPAAGAVPGMPPVGGAPGMPQMPMRKRGGRVDNLTKVKAEGMRAGTQVTHTPGKNDLKDIRDYPPITKRKGGAVYPKMHYGAGSGEGRLEKIEEYGHKR